MQIDIKPELRHTRAGNKANEILRKCVHCGFCLATCPTYQLLGDERDSPRGRIYLIKSLLEGDVDVAIAHTHLDRCLTCRACETTCPSGVEYGQLLDIGRAELSKDKQCLGLLQQIMRFALRKFLTHRILFRTSIWFGRLFQRVLPRTLQARLGQVPKHASKYQGNERAYQSHTRKVILFQGCVQPTLTPDTNIYTKRILNRLGIEVIEIKQEVCCGAISHHLSATDEARHFMRKNIDAWWPLIEHGVEAIISTASGCGVMLKDYGFLLHDDADYAEKALQVSRLVCDVSEYISGLEIGSLKNSSKKYQRLAFHNPCTLQHGQKLNDCVELLLQRLGYELLTIPDAHSCCGSAGTYSILQPEISRELQRKKIKDLKSVKPEVIVTANIGCQIQLQEATDLPVIHWIELLEEE